MSFGGASTSRQNRAPAITRAGWHNRSVADDALDEIGPLADLHIIPYCGADNRCRRGNFGTLTRGQSVTFDARELNRGLEVIRRGSDIAKRCIADVRTDAMRIG